MMRFEPTLIVTRLVIQRGQNAAYDEAFHEGVNVIRGENSSGKSTILNCIYYGLGGDLADWSETALLCTRVVVEVRLNGLAATLSRDISQESGQPMEIFGGPYEASLKAPRSEWIKYPYRRSPNKESFSQAIFRLLAIPEVASDVSGNLTIHQILRVLYSDQLSPVETLFRYDTRFDPPALRDAVGRLLCGSYEARLYETEIEIRTLTRQFDALEAELKSLFAVMGKTDHSLTLEWLEGERRNLISNQQNVQEEIERIERNIASNSTADKLSLRAQNEAYAEVQRLQTELASAQQERDANNLAIADSSIFVRSLEQKIASLDDASAIAEHLGDVRFNACPACLAPIASTAGHDHCHLCKTDFGGGRASDRLVAIINEAAIQLKQSQLLQSARHDRAKGYEEKIAALNLKWQSASARLAAAQRLPSTEARERLRELNRTAGYLQRQMEDLVGKEALIQLVDDIAGRKDLLNNKISALRTENERLKAVQERQLTRAKTLIADEVRDLLVHDLRRQDSFENPQSIQFDFASNTLTVDGHTYFSASSRVILKSSFFLGFFAAATKDSTFRHPRFVMIDTIEDKGMEPERSHNFQNQILRKSREAKVEHQIIFATAMISPDLDDEEFLIGRFSTRDEPTLKIDS
ncbi:AAA family ATPase [Bradyrhizobium sp. AZCC 1693]|uniref:AAA family ATPase n=1 Tax=Bradyrhizobium sp. AZCC 1693 TaxID=3117029 RepID=UPI002FF16C5E